MCASRILDAELKMGNTDTYVIEGCIGCCTGNPCGGGDPPLEVTISWTSAPTANSGWGATTAGKLDMFGETWSNGETKQICPTSYSTDFTDSAQHAIWVFNGSTGSSINFNDDISPFYGVFAEGIVSRDGAQATATANFLVTMSSFVGGGANTVNLVSVNGVSTAEANAEASASIARFDAFGGSIKTNETVTISWQKSAFFP
jgi:hypothetical protein